MKNKCNYILNTIKNASLKTKKTAIYTVTILLTIIFAIYPATNSFFKKDNDRSLVYSVNLDKTKNGELGVILNEKESKLKEIELTISLKRDARYVSEGDAYTIQAFSSLPSNEQVSCTLLPSTRTGNIKIDDSGIITFENNATDGNVDIKCSVEKNINQKEDINVSIFLYESVNNETKFLYKTASYFIKYNDYVVKYEDPDPNNRICFKENCKEDGKILTTEEIYAKFVALWDNKRGNDEATKYHVTREMFENFINGNGTLLTTDEGINEENAKTKLLGDTFDSILGITRIPVRDTETGTNTIGYSFKFDDNLTGYVKTYNWYIDLKNDPASRFIYLSSTSSSQTKEALHNIITNYSYYDKTDKTTINGTDYTNSDLVLAYIDEYIKNEKADVYSVENLNNMNGIVYRPNGANTDNYPLIRLDEEVLDFAYNYLSKAFNQFRVSYYGEDYEDVMAYIFTESITNCYPDSLISSINTLMDDTASNLYKAVTCTSGCSEYTETILVGSDTYEIVVKPNSSYNIIEVDKVSDPTPVEENIKVTHNTEADMITDLNNKIANLKVDSKYKDIVKILSDNISDTSSNFYKAIISVENTPNDTESYYVNGKYYSITVNHNKNDNYNEIIAEEITLDKALSLTTTSTLPEALIKDAKDANSKLNKYITCTNNCDNYNDLYYDGTSYYHVITTNKSKYKKIEVNIETDFETIINNVYSSSVADSLIYSYNEGLVDIIKNISCKENCVDYYETHYDMSSPNRLLLFKIATNNGSNIISSSSLMTKEENEENKLTLEKLAEAIKKDAGTPIHTINLQLPAEYEDSSNPNSNNEAMYLDELVAYLDSKLIPLLGANYSGTLVYQPDATSNPFIRGEYLIIQAD